MVRTIATTLALFTLLAGGVSADTLLLDGIEMDAQTVSLRPRAGMSMAAVESAFGSPAERRGTVGQPPITRWDYPAFSVYFEHETVIHSVARR